MMTSRIMLFVMLVFLLCRGTGMHGQEIYQAVRDDNLELVKKSLEENPDVLNQKNRDALTPLNLAAEQNRPEIAAYLLEQGADPRIGDNENSQPLHLAAISGSLEIMDLLLDRGIDINLKDDNGMTPLHFALSRRQFEAARHLVEKGADVNAKTNRNWSPLLLAAIMGSLDDVKYLVDHKADVNARTETGMPVVHTAASYAKLDVVKYLEKKGAKLDAVTDRGENILFWTRNPNCGEVVEYLISKGVDVKQRNERKETPLHYVAGRGLAQNVATLYLEKGADINASDDWGRTPLVMTAWSDDPAGFSKFLILNGADVNSGSCSHDKTCYCGPESTTPLHGAARMGHLQMTKNLVSNGARVNIYDGRGRTPLHLAIENGNTEMVRYLVEHGAFINTPEKQMGSTELHLAAAMGYGEIVDMLLKKGSDMDITDFEGKTPFDYAWRYGHKKIAYDMLAAGAGDDHLADYVTAPDPLKEDILPGEAHIWFLGHSGWAIKTENHFLVFDYFTSPFYQSPDDSCLSSGHIVPQELGYENVTVFCTHAHRDHYSEDIFTWKEDIPDIEYVLCWNPPGLEEEYNYIPVHSTGNVDDMDIYVNYSTDLGGGYLVEVDGLTIFHMGDHANGEDGLMAEFTDEIDLVAERTDHIDILFGGIRGCSLGEPEQVKKGIYYTLEKLQPELFVPMHAGGHSYDYKDFVETAERDGVDSKMKWVIHKGDQFSYTRDKDGTATTILD